MKLKYVSGMTLCGVNLDAMQAPQITSADYTFGVPPEDTSVYDTVTVMAGALAIAAAVAAALPS
jgi:hypothetical protein